MLDTHEDKLRTTAVHTDDHQPLIQIRDLMAIRLDWPDRNYAGVPNTPETNLPHTLKVPAKS
ncbi:hypothetical protein LB506_009675 [Fusarium annulatum]|nr:hypothetical protein LB506_009675 [Fusarium annulatum]